METKFYVCPICGNVIVKCVDSGVTPVCCGRTMQLLTPNTTDGVQEKHLPEITRVDECTLKVQVGSQPHPMTPEHHIRFIYLETKCGGQIKWLDPAQPAVTCFCTCKEPPTAVYAYCNLHGLWKTVPAAQPKSDCCIRK